MLILRKLKKAAVLILILCPEGIAIAILGFLMELIYRFCIYFNLLQSGLELLPLIGGVAISMLLLAWKFLLYFLKRCR